jgi:hypothetical protein
MSQFHPPLRLSSTYNVVKNALARERLDEQRLDVDGDAVAPARARIEQQRHRCQSSAHFGEVVIERQRISFDVGVMGGDSNVNRS